jgi:hypothetical protein
MGCETGVYIYTHCQPSSPGHYNMKHWELFLRDCSCPSGCSNKDDDYYISSYKKDDDYIDSHKKDDYSNKSCDCTTHHGGYKGEWSKYQKYQSCSFVRHDKCLYFSTCEVPEKTSIDNEKYWMRLMNDYKEDCKEDKYLSNCRGTKDYDYKPNDIDTTDILNMPIFGSPKPAYLYANLKNSLITTLSSHRSVIKLRFDEINNKSDCYDDLKKQLIINKPGEYKVTLHVSYSGVSCIKFKAFLIKSHESEKLSKDKKIEGSQMTHIGSSEWKNRVQYQFVVNVTDSMSSLVIVAYKSDKMLKHDHDNNLEIHGKKKTWMLIERLDN